MTYFNKHLARQETSTLVNNSIIAAEAVKSAPNPAADVPENRNYSIAQQLAAEKERFIGLLAEFPVTALWILNKYEQQSDSEDHDDDDRAGTDYSSSIQSIRARFIAAAEAFGAARTYPDAYLTEKQRLAETLQSFSFTFEDLTELSDLLVYAFKFRGCACQALPTHTRKETEILIKRLEGMKLRNKLKLPEMTEILQTRHFEEQYLFLPRQDMQHLFTELVFAEHAWLGSRQKLASANSRLVLFIANQYKGGFLEFDDLVQEGQTGLLKAVDRFNHELGFQFSTYAGYWIRQAISRALTRCERVVRLPFGQMATINKVFRLKEELLAKLGKEPSRAELAEYVGLSVEEINNILSISQTAMSFDGDEEDDPASAAPANFLEQGIFTHSFGQIASSELGKLLKSAINSLNPREAKIVCSHFGIDVEDERTLQQIGAELNLTRERVRQIQVMALNKIKLGYGEQLISFL